MLVPEVFIVTIFLENLMGPGSSCQHIGHIYCQRRNAEKRSNIIINAISFIISVHLKSVSLLRPSPLSSHRVVSSEDVVSEKPLLRKKYIILVHVLFTAVSPKSGVEQQSPKRKKTLKQ